MKQQRPPDDHQRRLVVQIPAAILARTRSNMIPRKQADTTRADLTTLKRVA